jgi:hypothetical protein
MLWFNMTKQLAVELLCHNMINDPVPCCCAVVKHRAHTLPYHYGFEEAAPHSAAAAAAAAATAASFTYSSDSRGAEQRGHHSSHSLNVADNILN